MNNEKTILKNQLDMMIVMRASTTDPNHRMILADDILKTDALIKSMEVKE